MQALFEETGGKASSQGMLPQFEPLWREPAATLERDLECEDDVKSAAIEEAFQRGFLEGQANAQAWYADVLVQEKQAIEAELRTIQEVRLIEDLIELPIRIENQFGSLKAQLRDAIVDALSPLLRQCVSEAQNKQLIHAIDRVVELNKPAVVKVSGPSRYVAPVVTDLEMRGLKAEVRDTPDLDVVVTIDETELRSTVSMWIARLELMLA